MKVKPGIWGMIEGACWSPFLLLTCNKGGVFFFFPGFSCSYCSDTSNSWKSENLRRLLNESLYGLNKDLIKFYESLFGLKKDLMKLNLIALFQFNRASIGVTVTTLTTLQIGPTTIFRLRDDEINVFFLYILILN